VINGAGGRGHWSVDEKARIIAETLEPNAITSEVARRYGLLREGSDMRFAFITRHRNIWPVAWLRDALDVSRSGFHAWLNRSPSARSRHDEVLATAIDRSFKSSDRTYGARRVWRDVLAEGLSCGLHRVERLMPENGCGPGLGAADCRRI